MKTFNFIKGVAFVAALGMVFTFGSCNKDSTEEPTSVSKTGLLTSSGWIINTGVISVPGQGDFNIMDFMDECDKDDIMTFKSDKSILYDEGATKCDPSDPQTETGGTWAFANNETDLVIDEDGDIQNFDIITLSSTDLRISQTEYDSAAMADVTTTIGFKHQ